MPIIERELNLNRIAIEDHSGDHLNGPVFRETNEAHSADGRMSVYFDGLEHRLCELIDEATCVFGCVAWLTSEAVLAALSKKNVVSIVVQKEDFLRPDFRPGRGWERRLRFLYQGLRCNLMRLDFSNRVGSLSVASDLTLDSVRCAGIYNHRRTTTAPRMHHKFLVFADFSEIHKIDGDGFEESIVQITPRTVWTGSFNLTRNATFSLENAVVLRDEAIAAAYFEEWAHIESLSEPLDWQTEWSEPQWRIGT